MSKGPQAVDTPEYWAERLAKARTLNPVNFHHAVFKCSDMEWAAIEAEHRRLLGLLIRKTDTILDCGCGWGRLIDLLPKGWDGSYCGIDVSPEMIAEARSRYGWLSVTFKVADLRTAASLVAHTDKRFDWAILVSVKPMIARHLGGAVWDEMEAEIRKAANRLLFLEYDVAAGAVVK